MIIAEQCFSNCLGAPVRRIQGRVELYEGSTLLQVFKKTDNLKKFSVERTGEVNKFFGFGVGQKLTVELVDKNREININKNHTLEAVFGTGSDYVYTNPLFYVEEVKRNENTNELTIIAYDALNKANQYTVNDLNIIAPYTLKTFALYCATILGLPLKIDIPEGDNSFDTIYPNGANFSGTENVRDALNAIAEATQTIYFIDYEWQLVFKRLGEAVDLEISKDNYFTLNSKDNIVVATVAHTTELGDNVVEPSETPGITCYVRDNPFWELRDDIAVLVKNAKAAVEGLSMNQFDITWRGNYLLEIGDRIAMTTKDDETIYSYVLNDSTTYSGGLQQKNSWSFEEGARPFTNPTTLGETLKETFAKVDKANKTIELLVSNQDANSQQISDLQMTASGIDATVKSLEQTTNSLSGDISNLSKQVSMAMTDTQVEIKINSRLDEGVDKVITKEKNFTFDDEGLSISSSENKLSTTITEDGMKVYNNSNEVLTANNEGVKAIDLHATTYLIIGKNSRFEDRGNRTACFWIGG